MLSGLIIILLEIIAVYLVAKLIIDATKKVFDSLFGGLSKKNIMNKMIWIFFIALTIFMIFYDE